MVQILLVHTSSRRHRDSIIDKGLLPFTPAVDGNYAGASHLKEQPKGVYASLPENDRWLCTEDEDTWSFPWTGPLTRDPCFSDGCKVVIQDRHVPTELLDIEEAAADVQ